MGVKNALIAGGTALGIGGTLIGAKAKEREAERQRGFAIEESREMAEETLERTEETVQQQKLAFIKSGIELTPDSPLLMLAETRAKGEEEARKIRHGGAIRGAQFGRFGRQALTGGMLQATQIGLQGASKIYGDKK